MLAWLLQPLTVQVFFDKIWGTTHYHVQRRCAGYFDSLLNGASAVEELLEHMRPEPSAVRLVREIDNKDADPHQLADGSLDVARVHTDFAEGYTIVLDRLERYLRAMTSLSHSLEVELNFPTQVNGYITPPEAKGFLPHYDHHDVLILQIQGSKTWHLYNDAAIPPHEMQRREEVDPTKLPVPADLRLEAGDTLYLPRGRIHAAETNSEPSVHLTVGIHTPTVLTLITHALHWLSLRDDHVHARLPPRYLDDADVRASLGTRVHDVLNSVEAPSVIAEGLGAMEDVLVRRGRCPPVGQTSDAIALNEQTLVAKYQPLHSRVTAAGGGVALQFAQLLISAGPDHHAALLFLSKSNAPFRVGDLPGLSAAQQTELARTLIASGFLVRLPGD